jgi:hypothetical protein
MQSGNINQTIQNTQVIYTGNPIPLRKTNKQIVFLLLFSRFVTTLTIFQASKKEKEKPSDIGPHTSESPQTKYIGFLKLRRY